MVEADAMSRSDVETEPGGAATETEVDRTLLPHERRRGRGARSNRSSRYDVESRGDFDDGWESLGDVEAIRTRTHIDKAKSIIARNDSPDISFDQSINPYRGCEHGCIYCYARPSHCYLGHSAGVDFETELYTKPNAARLLETELAKPRYQPKTIALGSNTDPYQPIEREHKITRALLEVLEATNHPVAVVTKSAGVLRDKDILSRMAEKGLTKVAISITTLDRKLARDMEPRAATPEKRLAALKELSAAGIPTAVMVAPIIPGLTDSEIERILEAAKEHGVREAGYVMLRLPLEIKDLFREWLTDARPNHANRVINHIQTMHGGRDYQSEFGLRQRGTGPFADQIAQRFRLGLKRYGLNQDRVRLRTDLFTAPKLPGAQLGLF